MLQARRLGAAICVQRFDDSLNPAIHITYRVSRRSSSLREPRDPSLKGVLVKFFKELFLQSVHRVWVKKEKELPAAQKIGRQDLL